MSRFSIASLSEKFTDRDRSIEEIPLIKHVTTNWNKPHHKLTSKRSITELCLWAWLTGHAQMAKDHGRSREERGRGEEEEAHRTPRRLSRRHGGAVPARPARCYPRRSSPRHHREHRTRRFYRRAHTPRPTRRSTAGVREKPARYRVQWWQRGEIPSGILPRISSEKRRPAKLFGGGLRGHRGECFTHGGDGGGHWSWSGKAGDGGGDPDRQRDRVGERRASGGWAGSVDRPRPEPGWLSRAEWASWASRPVGPAGQMGQTGLGRLF
jgi:hypothetical protein